MTNASKSYSIETALGELKIEFFVDGADVSGKSTSISYRSIDPEIPAGMSVEKCHAILLRIEGCSSPCSAKFAATLSTSATGSACTGEALEAIEWDKSNSLVVVGTEDANALIARMPWIELDIDSSIAIYTPKRLEIDIGDVTHPKPVSFHFIIAENSLPEPQDASAWFSVDIPHEQVLKKF